jgi:NADPH:quinone reductase-like Zn-dependent oxidoreductase
MIAVSVFAISHSKAQVNTQDPNYLAARQKFNGNFIAGYAFTAATAGFAYAEYYHKGEKGYSNYNAYFSIASGMAATVFLVNAYYDYREQHGLRKKKNQSVMIAPASSSVGAGVKFVF